MSHKPNEKIAAQREVKFRQLNISDVPLLHAWFNSPHVQEFYSLRQWTEEEVLKKVLPNILGEKPVYSFIVYFRDTPIGYVQYYRLIDFPWPDQALSDGVINQTAGMDIFIGDSNYLGKGYGKIIIKEFLNDIIWSQFDYCIVDPDVKNTVSIQCCEKLGFKKHKIIKTENALGNPVELCLMILSKNKSG